MFNVQFTPKGAKDLKKLPRELQERLLKKIHFFAQQEDPLSFSKPLVDLPPVTHRFRVGDYRVAFYIENNSMYIDRIRHRSEVYLR